MWVASMFVIAISVNPTLLYQQYYDRKTLRISLNKLTLKYVA